MSRIRAFVTEEHAVIDALLGRASDGDRAAFAELRALLLRHIAIEEKVILAAVREARGGEPIEGARRLRVEHGAIASLLVGSPDAALIDELGALLAAHETLEETPGGIWDACDEVLGDRTEAVIARARDYPAVPVAPHHDGPEVPRTVERALASARRMRFARG